MLENIANMKHDIRPTRAFTEQEDAIHLSVASASIALQGLREQTRKLEAVVRAQQDICAHDWRGQDDVHPHGTPMETFVCTICYKEERR